jgi:uncharacterized protein YdiU (UPF0061 family)
MAIKKIEKILKSYEYKYKKLWLTMMKDKIGINQSHKKDYELVNELLNLMHVFKLDYTNTFIDIQENNLSKYDFMKDWIEKFNERKELNKNNNKTNNSNPKIIPRNHIIEKVLNESEKGDYNNLNELLIHLSNPYSASIPNEFMVEAKEEEKVYQTFCGT